MRPCEKPQNMLTILAILTLRLSAAAKDDDCGNCCHDDSATCTAADGCAWWADYDTCWPDEGKDGNSKDGDWGDKNGDKNGDWGDKDGDKDGGKNSAQTGQTTTMEHSWNGAMKTRSYISVMPTGVPSGLVIVLLPDGDGCMLGSLAESLGVVVACPVAQNGWKFLRTEGEAGNEEDVDFIGRLILHLVTEHSIPAGKVIVTGFSFGATMAYRIGCERSQVIGGLVIYGQSFLDPSVGHIGKDEETAGQSVTDMVLERMAATKQPCTPAVPRPHYALVGDQDSYYGEVAGAYRGEALWEFYSTQVLGCSGGPVAAPVVTLGGCKMYESCEHNRYCVVPGMFHVTTGWEDFLTSAFNDFFPAKQNASTASEANAAFLLTLKSAGLSSALLVVLLLFS